MSDRLAIDFGKPIALFPLANCVLLPHATIPLHIFEPRYRAMTTDVLDSTGLIAMASFAGDDWRTNYEASPPLREHVCIGYIVRHEPLPDGRFNILLQGVCRARIAQETAHSPYRTALLEPTEIEPTMEIDLSAERTQIEALLNDDALRRLAAVSALCNWLSDEVPTAALVDLTIMTLTPDPEDKYAMLSQNVVRERINWLTRTPRRTRRSLEVADRLNTEPDDNGCHLN